MTKAEQYMNVMVCVLMADGVVADDERELFFQMVESVGLKPELINKYHRHFQEDVTVDIEAMIEEAVADADSQTLQWIIQDAYLMASADGEVTPEEISMINRVLRHASIPPHRFDEIREWAMECIDLDNRGQVLFERDADE